MGNISFKWLVFVAVSLKPKFFLKNAEPILHLSHILLPELHKSFYDLVLFKNWSGNIVY